MAEPTAGQCLKAWVDRGGALLRLRLNRPKANICDAQMIAALHAALDAHRAAHGLRGVLLDHEGPHFSFGASVEEHLAAQAAAILASLHALIGTMLEFPAPIRADKSFWVDINVPGTTTQSPTSTPDSQGTVLDFTKDMCTARWVSGAGQLPCPLTEGDARGFVLSVDNPKLENGVTDNASGLLMAPQNKYNGYLQGFYPEMIVRPGDNVKASVGCAYGYSCYVTYRLDYQINNGAIKILWTWSEKNEGKIYQLVRRTSPRFPVKKSDSS